jgi:hypothetical protein
MFIADILKGDIIQMYCLKVVPESWFRYFHSLKSAECDCATRQSLHPEYPKSNFFHKLLCANVTNTNFLCSHAYLHMTEKFSWK